MSGTLWALAYEPAIRSILPVVLQALGWRRAFSDDHSMAVRHRFEAALALKRILCDMGSAAHLRLNAKKNQLVDANALALDEVSKDFRLLAVRIC